MSKSESLPPPLRVGILVYPGQDFEPWELSLFERLNRHPAISLEAFLTHQRFARKRRPSVIFQALSKIERALFLRAGKPYARLSGGKLGNIPSKPAHDQAMAEAGLDVVLSHLPGADADCLLGCCKEFWEYNFYADASGLPELFGFHESLEAIPITQSAILRRMHDGSREVIATCTTNTKFSATLNAQYAKDMLPALVEREMLGKLRQRSGEARSASHAALMPPAPFPEFGWREVLRYGAKLIGRTGNRIAKLALARIGGQPDNWSLVIGEGDVLSSSLDNLRELPQPNGEFRADPFLFRKGGESWVFFEAWNGNGHAGKICVGRLDGSSIRDVIGIELGDVHLSYPYVFDAGGETFMIPETHERNRVEIWRCTDFPGKWTLHATALEGTSPADTTLIEWNKQWWMLTNLCSGNILDHCMELHVFRVDGPDLQHVEPHPMNPVVLDTTSARNAGRPFVRDGRLIRPAQITSHGLYGYGLKFMEITELSMDAYSEREVRRIEPDRAQATTGCHHIDSCDDLFIMDVRRAYGSKFLGARPIALSAS